MGMQVSAGTSERREAPRWEAHAFARLIHSGAPNVLTPVRVIDVSATGVQIHVAFGTEAELAAAASIRLLLSVLCPSRPRMLRLEVQMVRASTDETGVCVGLRFVNAAPEDTELLAHRVLIGGC